MDWDGNQEKIRELLDRAESMVEDMVYCADPHERGRAWKQVSKDIYDTLARCENMTRWLKRYERDIAKGAEADDREAEE